jgi:hypothetical protein
MPEFYTVQVFLGAYYATERRTRAGTSDQKTNWIRQARTGRELPRSVDEDQLPGLQWRWKD